MSVQGNALTFIRDQLNKHDKVSIRDITSNTIADYDEASLAVSTIRTQKRRAGNPVSFLLGDKTFGSGNALSDYVDSLEGGIPPSLQKALGQDPTDTDVDDLDDAVKAVGGKNILLVSDDYTPPTFKDDKPTQSSMDTATMLDNPVKTLTQVVEDNKLVVAGVVVAAFLFMGGD